MKIVIIRKDSLKYIPPLLSVADILADLGHNVHIISTDFTPSMRENLNSHGITYQELNYSNYTNKLGMICSYIKYRYAAKKALSLIDFNLLWVEDAHTMTILGNILKKYKYVLQISELYNDVPYLFKGISKIIKNAQKVFLPEYNRSALYQAWFGLKELPILLPNKPYFIPEKSTIMSLKTRYQIYLDLMKTKKVILYQGRIHPERTIEGFVKAAALLGNEWLLVIMGKDQFGLIDKYKRMNPNILHIDFIPAPNYLAITTEAYIGILSYSPLSLNTSFCAPNKIFEYGCFSIPMVGNDIPGLKILEQKGAGILANENDIDAIKNAYLNIDVNHSAYATNSKKIFDETDNYAIIKNALKSIDNI